MAETLSRARKLILAAEANAWTPELRDMLRWELENRGVRAPRHANCGELADTLRLAIDPPAEDADG